MPVYEITAVTGDPRPWGTDMVGYRVTLRNADGRELANVDVSRKNSAPAPRVGEKVDGEVDTSGQYGPKLKATRRGGGGGGPRGKDPQERSEIRRQHSHSMALRWAELQHARGLLAPSFDLDEVLDVADRFYRQSGSVA